MMYEMLGKIALSKGDFQEAVNIFRRALDEKKSADSWLGLARAYDGLEDLPTASWACYKSLDLAPHHSEALLLAKSIEGRLTTPKRKYPILRQTRFRTRPGGFEHFVQSAWQPFFIKGINLGLTIPGYYPGEYPIGKKQYSRWFEQMVAAGFNTVRVYTIQSPFFYEALREVNEKKDALVLIQGIWIEPPENGNFSGETYLHYCRRQIAEGIDIIFGNTTLAERPGYPHGSYTCDVSDLVVGIIFGREWEGCPIGKYNNLKKDATHSYSGEYLSMAEGTSFELWICQMLNELLVAEGGKYGITHPVSTVCWPTLDPLDHPSESRYEDTLRWQGMTVSKMDCNENEDVESLDTAKIVAKKGNGFFATYHAYPYYPDFMNNDYLDRENPYSTYLNLLKEHHGTQPILIAEYGVPGSREVSHWHRLGWHHGGHDEREQGRINGEMIKAIHQAGMAGGVLFSWLDEWFKRNWLFMNYELPAERNAFWFNLQDAEQCYGLIAAYPNYPRKKVSLKGDHSEWQGATTLYQNDGNYEHQFADGADGARRLQSLAVQHDEGFIYLALTTGERIDLTKGHYVIGIDTCDPAAGEFMLPFNLGISSPVGLKFLVHITGTTTSRILVCMSYDKYLNDPKKDLWPAPSWKGTWVPMQNRTNERRISKNREHFYPARVFSMSALRHGSLDPRHPQNDSLADFHVSDKLIELRIPWGLIMITDPSSKTVYWKRGDKITRQTDGLRFVAFSYKPEGTGFMAMRTGKEHNAADMLPRVMESKIIRTYSWKGWNVPLYHLYEKKSLSIYRRYLSEVKP